MILALTRFIAICYRSLEKLISFEDVCFFCQSCLALLVCIYYGIQRQVAVF
jgi:hypothetical protein